MPGRITVLIITHKFREVMAFADEVSVLRRGRLVGGGPVATSRPTTMARMMVGDQEIHGMSRPRDGRRGRDVPRAARARRRGRRGHAGGAAA